MVFPAALQRHDGGVAMANVFFFPPSTWGECFRQKGHVTQMSAVPHLKQSVCIASPPSKGFALLIRGRMLSVISITKETTATHLIPRSQLTPCFPLRVYRVLFMRLYELKSNRFIKLQWHNKPNRPTAQSTTLKWQLVTILGVHVSLWETVGINNLDCTHRQQHINHKSNCWGNDYHYRVGVISASVWSRPVV